MSLMGQLISPGLPRSIMFIYILAFTILGLVGSSPTIKSLEDIRIVGGEDIDIISAPYQVSITYRGRHSCGGTIVDSDVVITAAHCIYGTGPENYHVRVGSSSSSQGGKLHAVGDLIWHPGFTYTMMDYDIAILWLAQPLTFSDAVAPIPMAEPGEEIIDGELTTVTGWGHVREGGGMPSTLQKVLVPKVSAQNCNNAYNPLYSITSRMLCAGAYGGGKDACQGDSGGPLVYNNKLAGVVSWGLGCARPDYPGVYAKVSSLKTWIDDNILFLRLKHLLRS